MDRQWILGQDVHAQDNLLDGFTFQEVIDALHANERIIDEAAVRLTVRRIMDVRLQDMNFLIDKNMAEIIRRAKEGR